MSEGDPMEVLEGRVAVVTGAASGIGRALADRFAAEGMRVVLADVEEEPLRAAAEELEANGAEVIAHPTDVSDRASVEALARATIEHVGVPHVLCNNAGVSGGGGQIWETTGNDWSWVLGVNLMGVVHGIQAFVPRMIAAGDEGHVVNTSSVLGLTAGGGSIYSVSKHAVTRLTEGLWHDLRLAGSRLGVSVLCPGLIATRIVSAGRNRPAHLTDADDLRREVGREQVVAAVEKHFLESGMPPAEVAGMVVEAIRSERFYVLTHPDTILEGVRARFQGILDGTAPPTPRPSELMGGAQ